MDPRTLEAARTRATALAVQTGKPYCLKKDGVSAIYVVSVDQSHMYPGVAMPLEVFIPISSVKSLTSDPHEKIVPDKVVTATPAANKADL